MLNLPDISQHANLDANRVLYVIRRENALCIAQISKLCGLERAYVSNLLNRLRNEGIIQVRSVPSPFPENFNYFYASETPLLQVENKIKNELRVWKSVFPRWSSEVHDCLLRHVAGLFRKLGFKGINAKGSRSRGDAGIKDKSLLSQINQGRADFDIVLASKFNNQRLIVEIKNRHTVPATESEVVKFGERIKHFPDYKAVFISRGFSGKALVACRSYSIIPVDIGVQVLTPRIFRILLSLPHYGAHLNLNGNAQNVNCDTWRGRVLIQWKLEDFLCDLPKEPTTVEGFIKCFHGEWREHYLGFVKFQAKLSLYDV